MAQVGAEIFRPLPSQKFVGCDWIFFRYF